MKHAAHGVYLWWLAMGWTMLCSKRSFFFDLPLDTKQQYNLTLNGTRWRGYMPLGGENSVSGTVVDYKEGLYL